MECPKCGYKKSRVVFSKGIEMNTFRVRKCVNCNETFYTEEVEITKEEGDEYYAAIKREQRRMKGEL